METMFAIGIIGIFVMAAYVILAKHDAITASIKADTKLTEAHIKQTEHDLLVETEARTERLLDKARTDIRTAVNYTVGLTKKVVADVEGQVKQDVAVVVDTITKGV